MGRGKWCYVVVVIKNCKTLPNNRVEIIRINGNKILEKIWKVNGKVMKFEYIWCNFPKMDVDIDRE